MTSEHHMRQTFATLDWSFAIEVGFIKEVSYAFRIFVTKFLISTFKDILKLSLWVTNCLRKEKRLMASYKISR